MVNLDIICNSEPLIIYVSEQVVTCFILHKWTIISATTFSNYLIYDS